MSHTCPICHGVRDELGILGGRVGCGHRMCRECVQEWARVETRCPMCRAPFSRVDFALTPTLRFHEPRRQPVSRVYLASMGGSGGGMGDGMNASGSDSGSTEGYSDDEDSGDDDEYTLGHGQGDTSTVMVACGKCRSSDSPQKILECVTPGCAGARHTYCCDPPLRRKPARGWTCPRCAEEPAGWMGAQSQGVGSQESGGARWRAAGSGPPSANTRGVGRRALLDEEAEWKDDGSTTSSGSGWDAYSTASPEEESEESEEDDDE